MIIGTRFWILPPLRITLLFRKVLNIALFLLYGRQPRFPVETILGLKLSHYNIDPDDYVNELKKLLKTAWTLARDNITHAQEVQKHHYDQKARKPFLNIGDVVYKTDPTTKPGLSPKFSQKFTGPYIITEVCLPNVKIKKPDSDTTEIIHVNRLKQTKIHEHKNQKPETVAEPVTQETISHTKLKRKPISTTHEYNLRSNPK